jgi:hypothetical protein
MDPIGEVIVAIGEAVSKDSFSEEKEEPRFVRALYYIVPISVLTGFYIWTIY